MDHIRRLLDPRAHSYEPVPENHDPAARGSSSRRDSSISSSSTRRSHKEATTFQYVAFMMVGIAMLWSWNMFMACATYFQRRFASNPFILNNFQSLILFVSCVANFGIVIYLSSPSQQRNANYPSRVTASLKIICVAFTLLALSTVIWPGAGPKVYLVFILTMVAATALATGMMQNGGLSWVNDFDPINTQAIMVGQGIAGVLPGIAQILSVLLVPKIPQAQSSPGQEYPTASPLSAFVYFITATIISSIALMAVSLLIKRCDASKSPIESGSMFDPSIDDSESEDEDSAVSFWVLLNKLGFHAFAVFFTFAVTMIYPVYTQAILSVRPPADQPRFFQPDVFIPWSFMVWNTGDLLGRVVCGDQRFTIYRPKRLVFLSVCRLAFIPLYLSCNVRGQGAMLNSDLVYWLIQLAFGFSNGYLGSCGLMAAPMFVADTEKHAAGGFMTMWLVGGLTAGSVLSFFVL